MAGVSTVANERPQSHTSAVSGLRMVHLGQVFIGGSSHFVGPTPGFSGGGRSRRPAFPASTRPPSAASHGWAAVHSSSLNASLGCYLGQMKGLVIATNGGQFQDVQLLQ